MEQLEGVSLTAASSPFRFVWWECPETTCSPTRTKPSSAEFITSRAAGLALQLGWKVKAQAPQIMRMWVSGTKTLLSGPTGAAGGPGSDPETRWRRCGTVLLCPETLWRLWSSGWPQLCWTWRRRTATQETGTPEVKTELSQPGSTGSVSWFTHDRASYYCAEAPLNLPTSISPHWPAVTSPQGNSMCFIVIASSKHWKKQLTQTLQKQIAEERSQRKMQTRKWEPAELCLLLQRPSAGLASQTHQIHSAHASPLSAPHPDIMQTHPSTHTHPMWMVRMTK